MNQLSKFYALSAIYFGLASAVGAQTESSGPGSSAVAEDARQDEFKHPMLEPRRGNELRSGAGDRQIERRGRQGVRQDGEIRRNVLPGATGAGEPSRPAESPRRDRRDSELP